MKPGTRVTYTFYGIREESVVVRVANGIVWLYNGRWMHIESCTVLEERS